MIESPQRYDYLAESPTIYRFFTFPSRPRLAVLCQSTTCRSTAFGPQERSFQEAKALLSESRRAAFAGRKLCSCKTFPMRSTANRRAGGEGRAPRASLRTVDEIVTNKEQIMKERMVFGFFILFYNLYSLPLL